MHVYTGCPVGRVQSQYGLKPRWTQNCAAGRFDIPIAKHPWPSVYGRGAGSAAIGLFRVREIIVKQYTARYVCARRNLTIKIVIYIHTVLFSQHYKIVTPRSATVRVRIHNTLSNDMFYDCARGVKLTVFLLKKKK